MKIEIDFNELYFNTSHVTVYRHWPEFFPSAKTISIHLMLRFIKTINTLNRYTIWFQYISCYGLSHTWHRSAQVPHHFNTSHVTVYLRILYLCSVQYRRFQYISCYGLSLSKAPSVSRNIMISIHLMLRFIKLEKDENNLTEQNFNTSHVTVYRDGRTEESF